MTQTKLIVSFLALALLAGCQSDNQQLADKAAIEAGEASRKQVETENRRATEMEKDLAQRHRFYQAVAGTYEGTLQTDQGDYQMRVTLVPSLPVYKAERTRRPEEVASDLNNLYFNAQLIQWNPASPLSATGCRIEQIRPDLLKGEINIASSNCPSFYSIRISDERETKGEKPDSGHERKKDRAREVATSVLEGKIESVPQIFGQMRPTTNPTVFPFSLVRVK